MKSLSGSLLAHYAGETTTLAKCLAIVRRDGVEHFLTAHDANVVVDGDTYIAIGGYDASAFVGSTGLSVDNLEVQAAIDDSGLTDTDILAGRLDGASYEIFNVNVADPSMGKDVIAAGVLGNVSNGTLLANLELRNLSQYLHQTIGAQFQKKCRWRLGDANCGVSLAGFTVTGTITAVTDRQEFTLSTPPAAARGLLTFTASANGNDDLKMEVAELSGSVVTLILPMPFDVEVGDAYSVYRGCNKIRTGDCGPVFDNARRFGGFELPGNDAVYDYPDAR